MTSQFKNQRKGGKKKFFVYFIFSFVNKKGKHTFGICTQGDVCDKTGTIDLELCPPITGTRNSPGSTVPPNMSLETIVLALIASIVVIPNIFLESYLFANLIGKRERDGEAGWF